MRTSSARTAALLVMAGLLLLAWTVPVLAQPNFRDRAREVRIPLNGVKVLTVNGPIERVVTGQSETVKVRVVNSREVVVFGLQSGVTTLHVWTDRGVIPFFLIVQEAASAVMDEQSENLLRNLGEVDTGGMELRVFTPQYREVSEFQQYIQRLLQDDGEILLSDGPSGKIFVLARPEMLDKIEDLLDEIDVPGEDRVFTRRVRLQNRPVTEMTDKVETMLSEEGKFVLDEETNSFLIVDKVDKVKQITDFLEDIDVRTVAQVRIRARFVELSDEAARRIGIDWQAAGTVDGQPLNISMLPDQARAPTAGTPGGIFADLDCPLGSGNCIAAGLRLLERKDLAKLISAPNVVTRNQQQAVLEIVNEQSYVADWDVSQTQGGSLNVTANVETITGGITLKVTPLIGQSDVIQLDVQPELRIVNLGQPTNLTVQGTAFPFFTPTTNRRTAELNVALKDGSTLVIGGLNRVESNDVKTQPPVLGDIPILGYLFKQQEDESINRNITIFLTAEIVRLREEDGADTGEFGPDRTTEADTPHVADTIPADIPDTTDFTMPAGAPNLSR